MKPQQQPKTKSKIQMPEDMNVRIKSFNPMSRLRATQTSQVPQRDPKSAAGLGMGWFEPKSLASVAEEAATLARPVPFWKLLLAGAA